LWVIQFPFFPSAWATTGSLCCVAIYFPLTEGRKGRTSSTTLPCCMQQRQGEVYLLIFKFSFCCLYMSGCGFLFVRPWASTTGSLSCVGREGGRDGGLFDYPAPLYAAASEVGVSVLSPFVPSFLPALWLCVFCSSPSPSPPPPSLPPPLPPSLPFLLQVLGVLLALSLLEK